MFIRAVTSVTTSRIGPQRTLANPNAEPRNPKELRILKSEIDEFDGMILHFQGLTVGGVGGYDLDRPRPESRKKCFAPDSSG